MQLSNKELGQYLKDIRESLGYSTHDINKLCEISQSYISLMENGKRRPSPIILKKLASAYFLDYIDLYEKAGYIDLAENEKLKDFISDNKQAFPLLGTVKAGYNYLASENIIGYVSIDKQLSDPENYFALKVIGDSMQPVLFEDDIVIIHRQNDIESGQVGIILIDGEEATIKKIVKHEDYIELIAFNSYYPIKRLTKDIEFKIIGKVTEARISKIFE